MYMSLSQQMKANDQATVSASPKKSHRYLSVRTAREKGELPSAHASLLKDVVLHKTDAISPPYTTVG